MPYLSTAEGSPGQSPEGMNASQNDNTNGDLDYDVLIVGAGLSGIFSLYRMRQVGLRTRVLEAGSAEGGTWYWYCIFPSE